MNAPVPIELQQVPPSVADWMRGTARQPNPPMGEGYTAGGPVPINLQAGAPPNLAEWMRGNARQPNPPMGQGYTAGGDVPVSLQGGPWQRGVARQPNPANLDGWFASTSSEDKEKHGAPNVEGAWVEQLEPQLPAYGLLHRKGLPDVKMQILWNAGCELYPSGAHVCQVYAQELGPADLVRFRLPDGSQGRAKAHRVYRTPGGQMTDNPRVIQREAVYKRAWLPASYSEQRPGGISGSWAQVSPADARVGLVHIPGIGTQQAYVFEVRQDPHGRLRANVRWREGQPARMPNNGGGEDAYIVHSSVDKSKWWCRLLPEAANCVRHDITKARKVNPSHGQPLGTVHGSVSAAASRAKVPTGGIWSAIQSGRARLVADRAGIKLVA